MLLLMRPLYASRDTRFRPSLQAAQRMLQTAKRLGVVFALERTALKSVQPIDEHSEQSFVRKPVHTTFVDWPVLKQKLSSVVCLVILGRVALSVKPANEV
jgi:hypothetical protein